MSSKPKMYAWAWDVPGYADAQWFSDRLGPFGDRLGLVYYPRDFDHLHRTKRRIAFVKSRDDAYKLIATEVPVDCVIVQDEVNITGLSGHRKTPEEYRSAYFPIYDLLKEHGYTVSTAGLAYRLPNVWQSIFHTARFDDEYHHALPEADVRATNPHCGNRGTIEQVLTYPGPWVVSPHPYRPVRETIFAYWLEKLFGVDTYEWVDVSRHPNVLAVALWCLQEGRYYDEKAKDARWQAWHGLWDRDGKITKIGIDLKRGLNTFGSIEP